MMTKSTRRTDMEQRVRQACAERRNRIRTPLWRKCVAATTVGALLHIIVFRPDLPSLMSVFTMLMGCGAGATASMCFMEAEWIRHEEAKEDEDMIQAELAIPQRERTRQRQADYQAVLRMKHLWTTPTTRRTARQHVTVDNCVEYMNIYVSSSLLYMRALATVVCNPSNDMLSKFCYIRPLENASRSDYGNGQNFTPRQVMHVITLCALRTIIKALRTDTDKWTLRNSTIRSLSKRYDYIRHDVLDRFLGMTAWEPYLDEIAAFVARGTSMSDKTKESLRVLLKHEVHVEPIFDKYDAQERKRRKILVE